MILGGGYIEPICYFIRYFCDLIFGERCYYGMGEGSEARQSTLDIFIGETILKSHLPKVH